jgi:peptide/nickel transport system permease protein
MAAAGLSATFLSLPSGLLAIVCLVFDFPPATAIAAVVFPRVFSHGYTQLRQSLEMPHVVMARAFGVKRFPTFWFHVAPAAIPAMIALAGVTVPLAFGAAIPVEALSDSPGVGQLAWRAALGRDVPLLVSITMLLTAVTAFANLASDIASDAVNRRSA